MPIWCAFENECQYSRIHWSKLIFKTITSTCVKTHTSLRFKALLQMVQSHDGSIRSVAEKGDTLLASVQYPSIREKMNRLKKDYSDLCNTATVRTCGQITVIVCSEIHVNALARHLSVGLLMFSVH